MKKIVAIILIVITLMGLTVCNTFANASDEPSDSAAEIQNAARLLKAANVFQVSDKNEYVLRGDFLKAVVSSFGFEDATTSKDLKFEDIGDDAKLYSACSYALSLGIISESSAFNPQDPVTYAQACKMLVEALGYGEDARYKGGFPVGYIIEASSLELDRGVYATPENNITPEQYYILMKNFLEAPLRITDKIQVYDDSLNVKYTTGNTILEYFHEWEYVDGIIDGDENTCLFDSSENAGEGRILINGEPYICNLEYTLGAHINAYVTDDEVVYVENSEKTQITVIELDNIVKITGEEILYETDSGTEKKIRLAGLCAYVYNGKATFELDYDDFKSKTGYLTVVDNNSDSKFDAVNVRSGSIMVVDSSNPYSECIYDAISGTILDISGDVSVKAYSDGNPVSASLIKPDNVIEYYVSYDKSVVEIHILNERVSGKVTEIGNDDVYIDSESYRRSEYFDKYNLSDLKVGDVNTYYLTRDGRLACVAEYGESKAILAYATGFKMTSQLSDTMQIRLFNEKGELKTVETTAKIKYNDTSNVSAQKLCELLEQNGEQVIKYKVNSDDKVCAVYTETDKGVYNPYTDGKDALKRYDFDGYESETKLYYKITGLFVPHFTVNDSTKIILVSSKELARSEAERFSIGSISSWDNDQTIASNCLLAYNVNSAGVAEALICLSQSANKGSVGHESPYGVIETITQSYDLREQISYKITIGRGNKYYTYFLPLDSPILSDATDADGNLTLESGDFVRYIADSNFELNDILVDFDISNESVVHTATRENYILNYHYGKIYDIDGSSLTVNLVDSSLSGKDYNICALSEKAYVWEVDRAGKKVVPISPQDLITMLQDPVNADKILVRSRYAAVQEIVVYR